MQQAGISYYIQCNVMNECNCQMYNSFQPLMTYTGMHAQMKRLANDFDKKVLGCVKNLIKTVQV